jgi:amino acid transporter
MGFVRSIGRWGLTALVINCIIGSGIFGVSGELIATVGRASPIAMIIAGLASGVLVACFAEVGSRFSQPGGVYLYARTAFGRFVGLQVGWFWFLSSLAAAAASANLFVNYLAGFAPWATQGWPRVLVMTVLVLIPAAVNYRGVRHGTILSTGFTIAKLLPLVVLILLGLGHFSQHLEMVRISQITEPGWPAWGTALLVLSFTYSGFEDVTMPTGEIREPQRTIPWALIVGLGVCMAVYALLQFIVVATIGTVPGERPLATSAALLIGHGGEVFIEVAAMVSTYGWLSASMLNAPRFLFSLADRDEFPAVFGRLHSKFNTPHLSVVVYAGLVWLLAITGSFRWALLVSSGAAMIFDGAVCATLPRLRRIGSTTAGFCLPFGPVFSVLGIVICAVLLSRLELKQALLLSVTALIAAANWWWARKRASADVGPQTTPPIEVGPPIR